MILICHRPLFFVLIVLISSERIKVYQLTNSRYRNWFGNIDNFIIRDQNMIDTIIHRKTSDIEQSRYDLQVELNKILGARWSEKIRMDDIYWSEPWYTRAMIVTGKTMLNVYEGIEGLFKLGAMIIEATGDVISFQLKLAGHMADGEFEKAKKQLEDQGIKIANSVEEMKTQIEEGYAILEPIMNDPESRDIVMDFLSAYVDSMPIVDKGAAALTIPFEVLLALATAGLGAAVAGSGAVRHAGQFTGKAIELMVGLSKVLSKARLDKKIGEKVKVKPNNVSGIIGSSGTKKSSNKAVKTTDAKPDINKLGDGTGFKAMGVNVDPSESQQGRLLMQQYRQQYPEMSRVEIKKLARSTLETGKDLPEVSIAKPGDTFYKLIPTTEGRGPSPKTAYWMDESQLKALSSDKVDIGSSFGLPNQTSTSSYKVYKVSVKEAQAPLIFRSEIAPVVDGGIYKTGGQSQTIIPKRSAFSEPVQLTDGNGMPLIIDSR